jgi:hypothetical protein
MQSVVNGFLVVEVKAVVDFCVGENWLRLFFFRALE